MAAVPLLDSGNNRLPSGLCISYMQGARLRNMPKLRDFIVVVVRHWGSLVTGGVLIGVLGLWQNTGHSVPPTLYWAIALSALLLAGYKAWNDKAKALYAATQQLNAAPKLICTGASSQKQTIWEEGLTGSPAVPTGQMVVVGTATFYHLKIANEPAAALNRMVAEQVAARVQLFGADGSPAAAERLHRWEDSPGPAEVGKQADRLVSLDIPPNGIEYKLDLAMKYAEDRCFHTPNNETVLRGVRDWREPEFRFGPGTYTARIHLRGSNVSADMKCLIVNRGCDSTLEIKLLGD